ncbi:MAG: flavin reductase family protein [Desulfobacterales bacterium]|nr:flavin reductase family protein [Desulfobacterales bacterium]
MKKSLGAKTILYPTPALAIGSYDKDKKPNVMTAAWGGICCSKPPCVAVSIRKARYTYGNILEHKAFTVNIPSVEHVEAIDYFGITSGRKKDKFKAAGMTPVKSEKVDAPYIEEFPVILECKLLQVVELGVHFQFIGEIIDVMVDEDMLDDKGVPDMKKIKPILFAPEITAYYGIGEFLGKAFSIGKNIS